MKFKVPVKLLASVFSLLFVLPFLIKSLDVSAEVEITKVSALTGRAFFGDTISAKYYLGNTAYSFNFEYYSSVTSPSVGLNVDPQSIISTPAGMGLYDFIIYKGTLPFLNQQVSKVEINDFYLRFGDYARGGFALSTFLPDGVTTYFNEISYAPNNYCGDFQGVCADYGVSSNFRDYYGIMYFQPDNRSLNFRPIYYDFDEGGVLESLYFGGTYPYSQGSNSSIYYFIVICPYIGSSMSGEPPAESTTAITGSPSTNIDVNVSVYVDNSGIESQLNEYLGADDTRITTYETINLGTFPTFNYDNATETINISQVVSQTGDGINSIWYLISGLFSSVPDLVWLVTFSCFMSIMSFVLWRKGG